MGCAMSVLFGASRRSPFGFRRETVANPAADVLNLFSDLFADLFAAGRRKQHRRCDTNSYSGCESKDIAQGVILATIEILGLVAKIGDTVTSAVNGVGNPATHEISNVLSLIQQIDYGF